MAIQKPKPRMQPAVTYLVRAAQSVILSNGSGYYAGGYRHDKPYWLVSTESIADLIDAVCAATGKSVDQLAKEAEQGI